MNHSTGGIPAPPEALAEVAEIAVAATPDPAQPATRAPRRSTVVLTILLLVALATGILAGVSRAQVAGRLTASDASLTVTRAELVTSAADVADLEDRVRDMEGRTADLQAEVNDTRASLTACQDLFVMGAEAAMQGLSPQDAGAGLAAKLISCFEGQLPKALF